MARLRQVHQPSKTTEHAVVKTTSRRSASAAGESEAASGEPGSLMRSRGVYLLCGEIGCDTAHNVITWVLEANLAPRRARNLTLIINSTGGDMSDAFAIIDVMKGSAIPIHTVGIGNVASSGLMIFLAGAKGHRMLTPNTSVLSHQWSWESSGKEHELLAANREIQLMARRMLEHYRRTTGQTDIVIREKLLPPHDVWMSAEEALTLGVCDDIRDIT